MNRAISIILIFFLVFRGMIYGYVYFDGTNRSNGDQAIVPPYFPFLVVDGNLFTCVAINSRNIPDLGLSETPFFRVYFQNKIKVDKLIIYNGYQKSIEVYQKNARVKEMQIVGWYTNWEERFETNITLRDSMDRQEINFVSPIEANKFLFDILSTYPGTRYDDVCISEIEFYYQGRKYQVVNLEEAKREFLKVYRKRLLSRIPAELPRFIVYDLESRFSQSLKRMGISHEVHILELDTSDGGIYVYRKTRQDFSGEDFTIEDRRTGKRKMNKAVAKKIGEWKLTEGCELMVKALGSEQWEKTVDFKNFGGTFLEGIRYDEEDGMDEILRIDH